MSIRNYLLVIISGSLSTIIMNQAHCYDGCYETIQRGEGRNTITIHVINHNGICKCSNNDCHIVCKVLENSNIICKTYIKQHGSNCKCF